MCSSPAALFNPFSAAKAVVGGGQSAPAAAPAAAPTTASATPKQDPAAQKRAAGQGRKRAVRSSLRTVRSKARPGAGTNTNTGGSSVNLPS